MKTYADLDARHHRSGVSFIPTASNLAPSRFSRATSLLRHCPKNALIYVILNGGYVDFKNDYLRVSSKTKQENGDQE